MGSRSCSLSGVFLILFALSPTTQATTYIATPVFGNAPLKLATKITSQSTKGYCAVATISNLNDEAQQGWRVEFNLGGNTLKKLHGAQYSISGDHVTVTPQSNDDYLKPHHQQKFEFCSEGSAGPAVFLASIVLGNSPPSATLITRFTSKDKHLGDDKKDDKADYCVTVEVRNEGPADVHDWRLAFDLGADILVSMEHGKANRNTGAVIVTPQGGHRQIKKGHERTIKYCARKGQGTCASPILDDRAPTIVILSPTNGGSAPRSDVLVTGMYSGPENTGVTVNGVVALTDGRFFYANNVPLEEGSNFIKAVATTPAGSTAESRIRIRSSEESALQITAAPLNGGLAPLKVQFRPTFISHASVQNISIDFNGDGTMDFSSDQLNAPLEFTYDAPGIYVAKAMLTDTSGRTYDAAFAVQALDINEMDRKFNALFSSMNNTLMCGDIDTALLHLSAHSRERYAPVFRALKGRFADIVRSYSPLQRSIVRADFSEYAVNRTINGIDKLFLIYFILDQDGVWRIDSM